MPIRGSIKRIKEAPIRSTKIAIIALLIAITALIVSLGKKVNNA
jgi:hypothetical protein